MKKKIDKKWKITDPDTNQQGRQITKTIFEFKEDGKEQMLIDLDETETKEKEHTINAYGYTLMSGENKVKGLTNIHDLYGKDAEWVIAECLFETFGSYK